MTTDISNAAADPDDTFEERVARLSGTMQMLAIRQLLVASDLWTTVPEWVEMDEADTGNGVIALVDVDNAEEGFAPNVTAVMWRIEAQASAASELTDGTIARNAVDGFDVLSTEAGALDVRHDGAGRWFSDRYRMQSSGMELHSYARLDVYPCAEHESVFHGLQRTHTTVADRADPAPKTKDVDLTELCAQTCA